jgi:hypothetical protein
LVHDISDSGVGDVDDVISSVSDVGLEFVKFVLDGILVAGSQEFSSWALLPSRHSDAVRVFHAEIYQHAILPNLGIGDFGEKGADGSREGITGVIAVGTCVAARSNSDATAISSATNTSGFENASDPFVAGLGTLTGEKDVGS